MHRVALPLLLLIALAGLSFLSAGCGGASQYEAYGSAPSAMATSGGYGGDYGGDSESLAENGFGNFTGDESGGASGYMGGPSGGGSERGEAAMYAQAGDATTPGNGQQGGQPGQPQQGQPGTQTQQATDAAEDSGPLLIYDATLHMSVFEVEENQRSVARVAEEVHGFLVLQNDRMITIRVPAAQFRDALARVEALGDVLHRNVQAQDVGEEFRDLHIRLRNAEATMRRLHALLESAQRVEDALNVQRELARVTQEVEQMRGRLRYLQHRLAFSTITVHFQPRPHETVRPEIFRLPFPWLEELGLHTLLDLRR